jgi:integrase
MARKEVLPEGMDRLPSGTLRVRLRIIGFDPITKSFPLFSATAEERRRQLADAKSWAEETRRQMLGGVYVSAREAENTTLEDALKRYERENLKGKQANADKDRSRIKLILADPIAKRPVAALRKTDIAAYRDELIHRGWRKSVNAAIARLAGSSENQRRIDDLKSLEGKKEQAKLAADFDARRAIVSEIAEIEEREGIKELARTTIANRLQLITRALKHVGQTVDGIPDLRGVPMPKASPGRERRVMPNEVKVLLVEGAKINRLLPLIIRFAVETALRRERILTVRTTDIRDIGNGKRAIVFSKDAAVRNKRTGVIPVTREIQAIIDEALEDTKEGDGKIARIGKEEGRSLFDVNMTTFTSWWKRLLDAVGIEGLHFHDLRHEATSRLFERGLTTAEVMSITGHSTTDMVDRYSHYSAGLVHDKLERGMDPTSILNEIAFLMDQYRALAGDVSKIEALWKVRRA